MVAKKLSLPYYLLIAGWGEQMKGLARSWPQKASVRIWTLELDSISILLTITFSAPGYVYFLVATQMLIALFLTIKV